MDIINKLHISWFSLPQYACGTVFQRLLTVSSAGPFPEQTANENAAGLCRICKRSASLFSGVFVSVRDRRTKGRERGKKNERTKRGRIELCPLALIWTPSFPVCGPPSKLCLGSHQLAPRFICVTSFAGYIHDHRLNWRQYTHCFCTII